MFVGLAAHVPPALQDAPREAAAVAIGNTRDAFAWQAAGCCSEPHVELAVMFRVSAGFPKPSLAGSSRTISQVIQN